MSLFSPLLFEAESTCFVPAESVYAVFDAKQNITKKTLEDASDKASSVRTLKWTSISIPPAGGSFALKKQTPILAGILALQSSWFPPFGKSFFNNIDKQIGIRALDLDCVLRHGSFRVKSSTHTKDNNIQSLSPIIA